jgi:hypothetical protein
MGARRSFYTTWGRQRCGPDDAPFQITAVLLLDEFDREAIG